jgi:Protein of unknown function, DUF547
MTKLFSKGLLLALLSLLGACASIVSTPSTQSSLPLSQEQAVQAWEQVLTDYVDDRGYVNFSALKAKPAPLHAYLQFIANTRFDAFSSKKELLAHHINAYNALSMFNVIDLNIPASNQGLWSRVQFFINRKHLIGGQYLSLYSYENDVIRPLGEPRIHFALNCSAVSCPQLPRKAFTAANLEAELDREARQFFSQRQHLQVDNQLGEVQLSQILEFFPEDFVPSHAPSLIDYARRYSPERFTLPSYAYTTRFIPYDWTIANSLKLH